MCLKYNLQERPECKLCDCVTRQQDMALSFSHHTFLIDCDTGVCVCLTGNPRPPPGRTPVSSQTSRAPTSRNLLRTCLTTCMKDQRTEVLEAEHCQSTSSSLIGDKTCAKRKMPTGSLPKPAQWTNPGGQNQLLQFLQDSLKRCLRRLASCVRTAGL